MDCEEGKEDDPQNQNPNDDIDNDNDPMQEDEENYFNKEELNGRFYRNEWPEKEELVMVLIRDVNDDGAYV